MLGGRIMQGKLLYFILCIFKNVTCPTLRLEGWERVSLRPQWLKQRQPSSAPFTLGLKLPAVLRTALTPPMELFSVTQEAAFLSE